MEFSTVRMFLFSFTLEKQFNRENHHKNCTCFSSFFEATLEELDALSEDNNNLLQKLEKYQDTEREKLEILEECEKLKCHNQVTGVCISEHWQKQIK